MTMKKNKFENLISSSIDKDILYKDEDGRSRIGRFVRVGGPAIGSESIIVEDNQREVTVHRKNVIGKLKRLKWFDMGTVPPDGKQIMLEDKNGEIKMGKLVDNHDNKLYEFTEHHFDSPYWHRPIPAKEFVAWSLVQRRK